MHTIDAKELDATNFVDCQTVFSESMRDNWQEVVSSWGRRPPFYTRDEYGRVFFICGRYNDVRDVMASPLFTTAKPRTPGFEDWDFFMGIPNLADSHGPAHDRLRRLVAGAFGPRRLAAFEMRLGGIIDAMLDRVEQKAAVDGTFEVMGDFCTDIFAEIVLAGFLGLTREQIAIFARVNAAFMNLGDLRPGNGFPPAFVESFTAGLDAAARLVEERRGAAAGDDIISALIAARHGEDSLSNSEIANNVLIIAAGAMTTTSASLAMALYNLCRHPDSLAALRADLALVPAAVEECLRFHSPIYFGFLRFAVADTVVGGTRVLQGMPVHAVGQAANFDPDKYPDPMRFDIARKPIGILSFGSGPHVCVGMYFARAILRVALAKILVRFPRVRLSDPDFKVRYRGPRGALDPVSVPLRVN